MTESIKKNIHFWSKHNLERLKRLGETLDRSLNYMVNKAVEEKLDRDEKVGRKK